MLIFLCYKGWKHKTQSGELEPMDLTAVQNDLRIWLDYLNYRHDDNTRHWYFLTDFDFDFEYKDWTGITKVLPRTATPTKTNVLRTVREATQKSSSGFIHVGAHCMYGPPGSSHIDVGARTTIYTEIPKDQMGTLAAYVVSSDGQRIYGWEFHSCLSDNPEVGRDGTITLSFDMCNAAAFLNDVIHLPYTYPSTADPESQTTAVESGRTRKQLVVFSSSQAGQSSGSLQQQAGLFGAATFLLIWCLHRDQPLSVAEIVQYINDVCIQRPEEHLRQSTCIASRYPITGPLRLLPRRTAML